ncbi:hypothetical protein [Actibacterium pelagium]|uniref:Membrane-bound lysozyme-inhibitor of c-type lysozyme n=1 Tax=Actibacterium pelagium TaxID=2029103 RepID=A0A917AD21_9RHOB|nr:hypothetical protein [Actibacterium pelagium]GGE42539.1 hypothetical protein GCM10011517_07600 [Actibacterium pelagium]
MKRILLACALTAFPFAASAQGAVKIIYACKIDQNCSSGSCEANEPPFMFQLVHDTEEDIGTVLFGDQSADTIAVAGMGTQDFTQLRDESSVSFSIRKSSGTLEVRAHGPAGSSLEKGLCGTDQ